MAARKGTKTANVPLTERQSIIEFRGIVDNVMMSRNELLRRFIDPRRNIEDECGYPTVSTGNFVDLNHYRTLYYTEAVAARVVQVYPRESWQHQPLVYEDEDPKKYTEFEKQWDAIGRQLRGETSYFQDEENNPVWEYLLRADILSGIGQFGVILLGLDDGKELSEPVAGVQERNSDPTTVDPKTQRAVNPPRSSNTFPGIYSFSVNAKQKKNRKLLFLRVFPEHLVDVIQYESNYTSPRFGQPVMYNITFNDPSTTHTGIGLPLATVSVHWTRVIHIADNLESSEVFGVPRMQQVLRRLLDLQKLYGGSAEMYWRGAFPGISLETHPQLGSDITVDREKTKDMMENYMNGLQRYLALIGMSAKSLAPQVVDPSPQIRVQLEAICIKLGVPMRVFMGSERGELASSQDAAAWNDRLKERQKNYIIPRIIIPFVDRLIQVGVLPEVEKYRVWWPDITSQTESEKAAIAVQLTTAMSTFVSGGCETIMTPMDFLTLVLGLSEEEATIVVDNAEKNNAEREKEERLLLKKSGLLGAAKGPLGKNGKPPSKAGPSPASTGLLQDVVAKIAGKTAKKPSPVSRSKAAMKVT